MATYKDILLLVDKVSEPLKKIQKTTQKVIQSTRKLKNGFKEFNQLPIKDRLQLISWKFQELNGKIQKVTARVGAFSKKMSGVFSFVTKVAGAYTAISGAVTMIGGAILRGSNKFADFGDRIDKMSQKIGMSRKSFQEWDYIMSQNGGNVESLQMGFKTLTAQIEGVQKGSKDSINAFRALGIRVKDSNGQFRKQDDVFNDSIRALQKIKDPTKKAILANRLFGRSATELKPLLNQEADAIDDLRKKANDMGFILSDDDIDNAVRYKDTMDTFSRFFEAKFAGVMMKIMPDLSNALEEIMAIAKENQEVFDNIGQAFKWIVGTALPGVIKGIVWVADALKNVGGVLGTFIGQIISIPTYISMAFNSLKTNLIIGVITLGKAIEAIIITVGKVVQSIANTIRMVFQGVIQNIMQWIQGIIDKIKWVLDKIPGINSFMNNKGIDSVVNNNSTTNNSVMTNSNNTTSNVYNTTNNYNSLMPFSGAQYAT